MNVRTISAGVYLVKQDGRKFILTAKSHIEASFAVLEKLMREKT
jgi:hypothetical protein